MEGNMKRVKKGILYISIIMLMFSMIITEPVPVHAYINVPSTVRVGIYYVNSYQNTTVTSFTASASGGINVGVNISGSYYPLYEHYGSDNLSVFLDSPGSKYFVRIGGVYSDRNSAVSVLNICKANGLPAYLVFDNNWQVWAGCFNDAASASNAATGTYASKTGGQPVTVVTSPVRDLRVTRSDGTVVAVLVNCSGNFRINPNNSYDVVRINGKGYRGYIDCFRYSDSHITVVNVVDFEEYLYGVVPNEIEGASHPEALKAQAVAARTYSITQLGKHMKYGFDLCNSECCQVYKGYDSEYPTTNVAVDQTRGEVVTFLGEPATIYYFASSGGMTENSENVWYSQVPYLRAVEDPYESPSYAYSNWSYEYTPQQIKQMLIDKGYNIGDILNIEISQVTESGRALELIVTGTQGKAIFTKEKTRLMTSPSLPSQKFYIANDAVLTVQNGEHQILSIDPGSVRIQTSLTSYTTIDARTAGLTVAGANLTLEYVHFNGSPSTYIFIGKGKGHGIGMSQVGAKGLAENGYTYRQILIHYFQGTEIQALS
jgi:stage II sporulation protein D